MKAHMIGTNKAGCRFAIVQRGDAFTLYRECQNYAAHVRGGIAKTWRYVQQGMTLEAAKAMFDRKIAGKARA